MTDRAKPPVEPRDEAVELREERDKVHVCKEQVYMGEAAQYRGALDRIRSLWPHIEIARPKHFLDRSVYDPGAPTCLRCKIEEAIGQQPTPTDDCPTCGYVAWSRRMWESNGARFCAVCEARQEKADALTVEKAALARAERAEAERDAAEKQHVEDLKRCAADYWKTAAERDALREERDAIRREASRTAMDHVGEMRQRREAEHDLERAVEQLREAQLELAASAKRERVLREALLKHACNCGCPDADPTAHDPWRPCPYRSGFVPGAALDSGEKKP